MDFNVNNSTGRFTLRLTVNETATDPTANTSTVSWSLKVIANTSYYFIDYKIGRSVILDGTSVHNVARADSVLWDCPAYGTITLASGTRAINHNTDGTKTLNVSFSIDMTATSSTPGPLSGSGSLPLTWLPRSSILGTISSFNVESTITIPITKYVSGYQDNLAIKIGSTTIRTINNITNGYALTFSAGELATIYGLMSTVNSTTFSFVLVSYDDGSPVGSNTKTATGTITNANPTVSATVEDSNATTSALTGDDAKLILYKSTARVTVTASGNKGATIASTTVNGQTVTGGTISFANNTYQSFLTIVTDSRGNQSTFTVSPVIIYYIPLTLSAIFYRTSPTNNEIAIQYSGNYFNGSFGASSNTLTVTWKYRLKGASTWTNGGTLSPTITDNTFSATTALGTIFDYTIAYELIAYYNDALTTGDTGAFPVSKGTTVFDWGEGDFNFNVPVTIKSDLTVDGNVLRSCCATGTDASLALNTGTITKVPLATLNPFNDSSVYSISNGGVKVSVAGNYMISGSVFITLTTSAGAYIARGIYINQNTTEIMSALEYSYDSNSTGAAISVAPKILTLAANDIIYLNARTRATSGTATPNHTATYLTIVKI